MQGPSKYFGDCIPSRISSLRNIFHGRQTTKMRTGVAWDCCCPNRCATVMSRSEIEKYYKVLGKKWSTSTQKGVTTGEIFHLRGKWFPFEFKIYKHFKRKRFLTLFLFSFLPTTNSALVQKFFFGNIKLYNISRLESHLPRFQTLCKHNAFPRPYRLALCRTYSRRSRQETCLQPRQLPSSSYCDSKGSCLGFYC